MLIALLITSYILFLMCLGAFIVCSVTGTKLLEKKSDAIAAYLFGIIAFGILTVIIAGFNLEMQKTIVNKNTVDTETIKTFTITGGETTKNNNAKQINQSQDNSSNNGKIIGDKDSKIYHVPGSTYYEKELKKLSNNEYFSTIEEAKKAGYRAPKK